MALVPTHVSKPVSGHNYSSKLFFLIVITVLHFLHIILPISCHCPFQIHVLTSTNCSYQGSEWRLIGNMQLSPKNGLFYLVFVSKDPKFTSMFYSGQMHSPLSLNSTFYELNTSCVMCISRVTVEGSLLQQTTRVSIALTKTFCFKFYVQSLVAYFLEADLPEHCQYMADESMLLSKTWWWYGQLHGKYSPWYCVSPPALSCTCHGFQQTQKLKIKSGQCNSSLKVLDPMNMHSKYHTLYKSNVIGKVKFMNRLWPKTMCLWSFDHQKE